MPRILLLPAETAAKGLVLTLLFEVVENDESCVTHCHDATRRVRPRDCAFEPDCMELIRDCKPIIY